MQPLTTTTRVKNDRPAIQHGSRRAHARINRHRRFIYHIARAGAGVNAFPIMSNKSAARPVECKRRRRRWWRLAVWVRLRREKESERFARDVSLSLSPSVCGAGARARVFSVSRVRTYIRICVCERERVG